MPVEDILEVLKGASGATLLLLDACRSNPVENELKRRLASLPGSNRDAATTRGFSRIGAGSGLIIAYATQANDVASDGFGRNSPFAKSFLKFAPTPNLDLRQMLFLVQDDVDRETNHKQRPELAISLIGEFKLSSAASTIVDFPTRPAVAPKPAANEEEIAWPFLRDTTDVAALRAFVAQFPAGTYRSEADKRIAELTRAAQEKTVKPEPAPSGKVAMLTEGRPARPRSSEESCADRNTASGTDHYCASSRLPGQFGNSYGVRNLFSGDSSVAWVEGASGYGIGEWITVEFDSRRSVRSVLIDNGYQKNSDIYYKNSRVRRVRLVFSSGESLVRSLDDKFGTQTISLDRAINAYWVQVVVEDVYRGSKYSDTAVTKLLVNSAHDP
jgi:Caspase domain